VISTKGHCVNRKIIHHNGTFDLWMIPSVMLNKNKQKNATFGYRKGSESNLGFQGDDSPEAEHRSDWIQKRGQNKCGKVGLLME